MQTTNSSTMQKLFPILTNKNVDMKKEIIAGVTTFLTMAYIIAVNPNILSETGMPAGALVTGTCLAAAFGCILMGVVANLPFALASGMGLNAFCIYSSFTNGCSLGSSSYSSICRRYYFYSIISKWSS